MSGFYDILAAHPFLASLLVKTSLIVVVGFLVTIVCRRSAATRHVVWLAVLIGTIAVPLQMTLLPNWGPIVSVDLADEPVQAESKPKSDIVLNESIKSESMEMRNRSRIARETAANALVAPSRSPNSNEREATDSSTTHLTSASNSSGYVPVNANLLVALWASGAILSTVPVIIGAVLVRRSVRRSTRLDAGKWFAELKQLQQRHSMRRDVTLWRSDRKIGPFTGGIFRPLILLPSNIDSWSVERFRIVMLHELGHVERWDVLVQRVARIATAMFWFHPLVWLVARRLRIERERACDEFVLTCGTKPSDYSQQLVEIAFEYCSPRRILAAAMTMATQSTLEHRIRFILNNRNRRRASSRWTLLLVSSVILAIAATIATAGKVVVRDKDGNVVKTIAIPDGGSASIQKSEKRNDISSLRPSGIANPRDWTQWGGSPQRNNVSSAKNLPTQWDFTKSENILWSTKLGSQTYGTPTIAAGRVFIGTNNGNGFVKRYPKDVDLGCLVCLDQQTGKFLWQHSSEKLETGRVHDWPLQGVCSTPLVRDRRLWFVTNRGEVRCLDIEGFYDGENDGNYQREPNENKDEADVIWVFDMMKTLGVSQHNMANCSVTLVDGILLVNTSQGVTEGHLEVDADSPSFIALDADTGALLWKDSSPGENVLHGQWSSPAYTNIDGRRQAIFGGGDGWLYSFALEGDGNGNSKLLWKFDCNPKVSQWILGGRGTRNHIIATPVVYEGRVYVGVGQDPEHGEGIGHLWCIDVTGSGDVSPTLAVAADGTALPHRRLQVVRKVYGEKEIRNPKSAAVWHYGAGEEFEDTMHRSISSVAISDGLLFTIDFSGLVHCLDANTGKAHWTHDLLAACWGSPLIADGKVFIGDEDGDVAVFKLSKEKELLAENNMANCVYSTPVAAADTLFVVRKDRIFAIKNLPAE